MKSEKIPLPADKKVYRCNNFGYYELLSIFSNCQDQNSYMSLMLWQIPKANCHCGQNKYKMYITDIILSVKEKGSKGDILVYL